MPAAPRRYADRPFAVTLAYALIAVVMTWPLARHLGTRLAADVGDPAFNSWVLAWTAGQILAALSGDFGALASYWHGNIFTPEPLTLAYSEHLTAQALQVLPIYAVTGNILVAYNTLFIATFALSGLAMYLLVRDLTREPAAAFVAGLAFAYAPYRLGQFSHVQVLSSYWMPLVLLGLHRFFVRSTPQAPSVADAATPRRRPSSRTKPLAGASAALVLQNLSCGYYMLFFAPFVAAYVAYEMVQRRLITAWRIWGSLAVAVAAVALLTWPFVRPYFQVREQAGLGVRSREEIQMFSADAHALATIAPNSRLLAERFSGFPNAEGEGYPGLTIVAFALVGAGCGITRLMRGISWRTQPEWLVLGLGTTIVLLAGSGVVMAWYFVHGRIDLTAFGGSTIYQNASQPLAIALASAVAFAGLTTVARRRVASPSRAATGFFIIATAAALLFALGPRIHALGRDLGPGPYQWLLALPGYDGLRVPARFLMLVAMFLAALCGLGAATLLATRYRRAAIIAIGIGSFGILAEAWVAPLQTNQPVIPSAEFTVPPRPASGSRLPPIYRDVMALPDPVVLAELPFGEPAYDVLAVFYAGHHRRPLLNGYSGFFPRSYVERAPILRALPDGGDRAAGVLRDAHVTHVLVHEAAFANDRGKKISEWLLSLGARQIAAHGQDRLFALQ